MSVVELPTTLSADDSNGGGLGVKVEFKRIIVFPDGRQVEQLPAPGAPHALPKPTDPTDDTNERAV